MMLILLVLGWLGVGLLLGFVAGVWWTQNLHMNADGQ